MYYSQIRVDPKNPENVYVGGLNFSKSTDGGKTFRSLQSGIAHSDNHAIWINPANGDHMMVGNDGGLNVSYDQGATWEFVNTIPAAQFYAIGVDMRKPYYVYGGLQDNGSWGGPSQTRSLQAGITNADWYRVGGGDGFYTQIDPTDYNIVYAESQGGAMQRLDLRTGRSVEYSAAWRTAETRGTRRWSTGRCTKPESVAGCFANSRHRSPARGICCGTGIWWWLWRCEPAIECGADSTGD